MFDVGKVTANWGRTQGLQVYDFAELESTARWVHQQSAEKFLKPSLVVTSFQTLGRGRTEDRVWIDAGAGTSLCANWVFPIWKNLPQPPFTEVVGRGLLAGAQEVFPGLEWSLKLPNDILLSKKKCAGLLVEVIQQNPPSLVSIGLGFNVFASPSQYESTHLSAFIEVTESSWTLFLQKASKFLSKELGVTCLEASRWVRVCADTREKKTPY